MLLSVFLSYSNPFTTDQKRFLEKIIAHLTKRGIQARTLGITDYDMKNPLTAIRRMMMESSGLLTIAFRRTFIEKGIEKPNSDLAEGVSRSISNAWYTSPYCHIEPAMAFQIGLPILILREKGVIADGILEKGITGIYLPEFDLEQDMDDFFKQQEWIQLIGQWESYVRQVSESKGFPPKLY